MGKPTKMLATVAISASKWRMNNVEDLTIRWGNVEVKMCVSYSKSEIVSFPDQRLSWIIEIFLFENLKAFPKKSLFDFYRGQNVAGTRAIHER